MENKELKSDIKMCIALLQELDKNHYKGGWTEHNKSKVKRIRITINELLMKHEK